MVHVAAANPAGVGSGAAPHALQKLRRSSARFGLSAVPSQAGPTRSGPALARKQENRRLRSRRWGRRVRGPRRQKNRRTGGRGAAGGADASEVCPGKKTGEQEIFYGSPLRLLFSCFRHGARRFPMPPVLLFSGPARGGSACLLFSCSRLDHARRGPARNPNARGRVPAAQRRDAGAEGAERAGARRFARVWGERRPGTHFRISSAHAA